MIKITDQIEIAYQWLDAQEKVLHPTKKGWALKHMIERWGGTYIREEDVVWAARLHHQIFGVYPNYNISERLVLPDDCRLIGIPSASTTAKREPMWKQNYSVKERW